VCVCGDQEGADEVGEGAARGIRGNWDVVEEWLDDFLEAGGCVASYV